MMDLLYLIVATFIYVAWSISKIGSLENKISRLERECFTNRKIIDSLVEHVNDIHEAQKSNINVLDYVKEKSL